MKNLRACELETKVMPAGIAEAATGLPCGIIIGQIISLVISVSPPIKPA